MRFLSFPPEVKHELLSFVLMVLSLCVETLFMFFCPALHLSTFLSWPSSTSIYQKKAFLHLVWKQNDHVSFLSVFSHIRAKDLHDIIEF